MKPLIPILLAASLAIAGAAQAKAHHNASSHGSGGGGSHRARGAGMDGGTAGLGATTTFGKPSRGASAGGSFSMGGSGSAKHSSSTFGAALGSQPSGRRRASAMY